MSLARVCVRVAARNVPVFGIPSTRATSTVLCECKDFILRIFKDLIIILPYTCTAIFLLQVTLKTVGKPIIIDCQMIYFGLYIY